MPSVDKRTLQFGSVALGGSLVASVPAPRAKDVQTTYRPIGKNPAELNLVSPAQTHDSIALVWDKPKDLLVEGYYDVFLSGAQVATTTHADYTCRTLEAEGSSIFPSEHA